MLDNFVKNWPKLTHHGRAYPLTTGLYDTGVVGKYFLGWKRAENDEGIGVYRLGGNRAPSIPALTIVFVVTHPVPRVGTGLAAPVSFAQRHSKWTD
ncbi:MAG: hypothetical protein V9G14_11035 [Cypionkella sp.]